MHRILFVIFIILFSFSFAEAKKNIVKVTTIEFDNLRYISKYEIINPADIYLEGKLIVIDLNSLKNVLNSINIIESFDISIEKNEKDQRLIISVKEKNPEFSLCIIDGDKYISAELDNTFQIISTGRMYKANLPLIYVFSEEINKQDISQKLKRFLNMISNLKNRNLNIINDILEIDYLSENQVKVTLEGRKTNFFLRPEFEGFENLNYAVGYFDMIKYYPDTFTMLNGYGIVGTVKKNKNEIN